MKKFFVLFLSLIFVLGLSLAVSAEDKASGSAVAYVGAKKCKACHIKQYKSWAKTTMATSFENLKMGVKVAEKKAAGIEDKDYTHDPECLKCHTTGYGQPGGFVSIEETPKLANVQCEECHGPGSIYNKTMKKVKKSKAYKVAEFEAIGLIVPSKDEAGCMRCHGDDSPFTEKVDAKYKFDFKDRLEKTHKHYPLKYKKD
jgi:hypothetical protein